MQINIFLVVKMYHKCTEKQFACISLYICTEKVFCLSHSIPH